MTTSRSKAPALQRLCDWLRARRAAVTRAHSLPDLLARLGRVHAPRAARLGVPLHLDIDPALAPDPIVPLSHLGRALDTLLHVALDCRPVTAALNVDVVGDAPGRQEAHFTVYHLGGHAPDAHARARWHAAEASMQAAGGQLRIEARDDGAVCAVAEVSLRLPPKPPWLDLDTLRDTLGGEQALRQVVAALDDALGKELGVLPHLLAARDGPGLKAWLHRVSGVLGMAEATDLSAAGVHLERRLDDTPDDTLNDDIRAFAAEAEALVRLLRQRVTHDRL